MNGDGTNTLDLLTAVYLLGGGPHSLLAIGLQVACAVHCVRHRKEYYWLAIIIFLSIPGSLCYFFLEWYPMLRGPGLLGSGRGRRVSSRREIRRLEEELRYSDTVARRIRIAEAYRNHGEYQKGLEMLKDCCTGPYKDDGTLLYPLAQLHYLAGDYVSALEKLSIIKTTGYRDYQRERTLLEAKACEQIGSDTKARDLYLSIQHLYPGEEVRCRLALLLLKGGDRAAAAELFREMQFNAGRSSWAYRRREREWLCLARAKLKELER